MRFRVWVVASLFALAAVGCSRESGEPAAEPKEPGAPVQPAAPAAPVSPALVVALGGDGLRLVTAETGATRPLPFGTPERTVAEALERASGAAVETGANSECGEGPMSFTVFRPGLQVWFQNGRFVGWAVRRGAEGLTTIDGVGLGVSEAALRNGGTAFEYPESTLGREFFGGGLSGLIENGRVAALWAGQTCVFR